MELDAVRRTGSVETGAAAEMQALTRTVSELSAALTDERHVRTGLQNALAELHLTLAEQ